MNTGNPFQIARAFRSATLSSLCVLATVGAALAQEELVIKEVKLLRAAGDACTVTFGADEGQQIMAWASTDLECWDFAGICHEVMPGGYQFIDLEAMEVPGQFYRFECFDAEVPLPPRLEQLRLELGDESFAQWLQSNFEQFGTLQGISPDEVDQNNQEQFEETEKILDLWLKDLNNEAVPLPPEIELPTGFEDLRQVWGDYDFTKLLVDHLDDTGSFQGICEQVIVGLELTDPLVFEAFQHDEVLLGQWVEDFVFELPPSIQEEFMEDEFQFPPHLENLRLEMGDEMFAEWLRRNLEQSGNFHGISETTIPEEGSEAREEFDILEGQIQKWLNEQGDTGRG